MEPATLAANTARFPDHPERRNKRKPQPHQIFRLHEDEAPEQRPAKPPKLAEGRLILGKLVIPCCPHCGERHRHRFRGFDVHYEAICTADGGYVVQQAPARGIK